MSLLSPRAAMRFEDSFTTSPPPLAEDTIHYYAEMPPGDGVEGEGADAAPLLEAAPDDGGTFMMEAKSLMRLAAPLVLQNVFGYSLSIVSAAFIGHLNDPVVLSSTVLAGSIYNITGYSLIIGLSGGMETLCGQAYGARNYLMLGLVLQRALLVCWAACVPITLMWQRVSVLLGLLHQAPEIVDGAARYLSIASPALFLGTISSCLYRYLVTQQEVLPSTICTVITAVLCPLYNWLLIYRLDMGLDGAAYAFVLSTGTYSLLLGLYTACRDVALTGTPKQTWPGLSVSQLFGGGWEPWAGYLRIALPSAAMIAAEWWVFETVIVMAGSLGPFADVAVSVMGLSFHITSWTYMIPMSLGTAANTRVSNGLGAGHATAARRSAFTSVLVAASLQLFIALSLYTGRHSVARVFTADASIVYNIGRIMPVIAFSALGDGMNAVLSGVLRGSGRQAMGAGLNIISFWGVGAPLAALLGFWLQLDVLGFWLGLATATTLQGTILINVVSRLDWPREVERARALMARHTAGNNSARGGGRGSSEGVGAGGGVGITGAGGLGDANAIEDGWLVRRQASGTAYGSGGAANGNGGGDAAMLRQPLLVPQQ